MKNSTLLACAVAVVLAGCGGGGGGNDDGGGNAGGSGTTPTAAEQVPASASASTDGFVDYLLALFNINADSLEPVDVSNVTPVQSDEAVPNPII